eukprot:gene18227-biopygen3922
MSGRYAWHPHPKSSRSPAVGTPNPADETPIPAVGTPIPAVRTCWYPEGHLASILPASADPGKALSRTLQASGERPSIAESLLTSGERPPGVSKCRDSTLLEFADFGRAPYRSLQTSGDSHPWRGRWCAGKAFSSLAPLARRVTDRRSTDDTARLGKAGTAGTAGRPARHGARHWTHLGMRRGRWGADAALSS